MDKIKRKKCASAGGLVTDNETWEITALSLYFHDYL
jgi:hypothetical protein